jgi:hypothetical protein
MASLPAFRPDPKCPDCGSTHFVEDRAQGDVVCKVGPQQPFLPAWLLLPCSSLSGGPELMTTQRDPRSILAPLNSQGCGLVTEAHIIDERSEWRTFSDKVCVLLCSWQRRAACVAQSWFGRGGMRF